MDQSTVKILHDVLSKTYLSNIQTMLSQHEFPWFWNNGTLATNEYGDVPQFTHTFFDNTSPTSNYFTQVRPIIAFVEKELNIDLEPIRIKANLLCKLPHDITQIKNPPHIDQKHDPDPSYFSFVYYPFNCEGDTLLYEEFFPQDNLEELNLYKSNTPKENSCIFFNSNRYHSSSSPTKSNRRMVLNFVVKVL